MKINQNPSIPEVRRFAFTWASVTTALGGLLLWRGHPVAGHSVWALSTIVGVCGLFVPTAARHFYFAWMTLAQGINFVVTRLALVFIFWGVLTPLALIFRIFGRDVLERKESVRARESYWKEHELFKDNAYYRHLY